jgi:hypothetical protein
LESAVQGVGSQLGGMTLRRRQAPNCLIDSVYIDQSSLENRRAVDHLGNRSRGCAGSPASLGVEGNAVDAPVSDQEREPRQVPTSSPTRSARESAVSNRPKPPAVTQVVLEKLPLHTSRVERQP